MSSAEVYAIAAKCNEFADSLSNVALALICTSVSLNENQVGEIADAISDGLQTNSDKLYAAESNLREAATVAKNYADQLAEAERIEEERRAAERAERYKKRSQTNQSRSHQTILEK